jgi:hypothetical protein
MADITGMILLGRIRALETARDFIRQLSLKPLMG